MQFRSSMLGLAVLLLAAPAPATTRYVWSGGSQTAPYTNWATAAKLPHLAVNLSVNGDTVLITNGTYLITQPVNVTNGVTVKSVNGRDVTILNANAGRRNVYMTHASGVVDGLTLTNGYNGGGGGGAVWMTAGTLKNSRIGKSNSAGNSGGGINMSGGLVTNCLIDANRTVSHGGGIYMSGGLVRDCQVLRNAAASWAVYAGGVYISAGRIENSSIISNGPTHSAGGLYISGTAVAENCLIAYNTGNYEGGGVRIATATAALRRCIIRNNRLQRSPDFQVYAGGVVGVGILENCLILENFSPGRCGGAELSAGSVVRNCIIAGNTASLPTGVGLNGSGASTVYNTIIYYNCQSDGYRYFNHPYAANTVWGGTIQYSCTTPAMAGTGNISAPPEFVSRITGDYRLLPGSPCIDKGTNLNGVITNDMDNATRPVDGDGNGNARTDMGIYEMPAGNAGSLRCSFVANPNEKITNLTAVFTASVAGADTNITWYGWDFTADGTMDISGTGRRVVTNQYASPGLYNVRLVVTNSSLAGASLTRTSYVYVAATTIYVATNGSQVAPFSSWATAARSIQLGLDASVISGGSRCTVLVSNGTYLPGKGLYTVTNVDVRSVNGAAYTTISGENYFRGFYLKAGVVDGFTLQWCRSNPTETKGAAVVLQGPATLRACTVRWSTNASYDGAVWLNHAGALVDRCHVTRNRVNRWGGGIALEGVGGTVRNTLVTRNVSVEEGAGISAYNTTRSQIENCTVISNQTLKVGAGGGGIWRGVGGSAWVTNCIVYFNKSPGPSPDLYNLVAGAVRYTCSRDVTAGVNGNTTLDPELVDLAGGDYHLRPGSPCLDTGTNLATVTDDCDGAPRPADGTGDAIARHDMGAYERAITNGPFTCNFVAAPLAGTGSLQTVLTSYFTGPDRSITWYGWDFNNDGTFDLQGPNLGIVTNVYGSMGLYGVRLLVTNASAQAASCVKPAYLSVYSGTRTAYVSPAGSSTWPFDTWARASTTFQPAIDVGNVTTVWVTNGSYGVSSMIELKENCRVQSVNGPAVTTVYRASGSIAVFGVGTYQTVTVTNSILAGFTITNGNQAAIWLTASTVSNCVIKKNVQGAVKNNKASAVWIGGPGTLKNCLVWTNYNSSYDGAVWVGHVGGVIENCMMVSNRATRWGGGVAFEAINGGAIRNSLVAWNYSATSGGGISAYSAKPLIVNCTIVSNRAVSQGGGIWYDQAAARVAMTNSIVWYNAAPTGPNVYGASGTFVPGFSCAASPAVTHGVSGNITNAPRFKSMSLKNYRLDAGSPCINTGTNLACMLAGVDLDGYRRLSLPRVDMGAYEVQPTSRGSIFTFR